MIFGHKKNLKIISEIIKENKLPHALLFSGPDCIGKRKIAIEIAKYLQGEHKKESFFEFSQKDCNCDICREIENGNFSDLIEIQDEEEQISIKEIRKIKEKNSYSSVYPFKIFILNNIEKLSSSASGALLKTLEEPSKNTIFFLLTQNSSLVLKTILSRVTIFKFSLLSKNEIGEFLKEIQKTLGIRIDRDEEQKIIDLSLGRPGKAKEMLLDKKRILYYNSILDYIEKLPSLSIFKRMELAKRVEEGGLIFDFLIFLTFWFEDILLSKIGLDKFNFNFKKNSIIKNAEIFSEEKIKEIIKNIQKIQYYINFSNTSKLLALENLFLEI